MITRPQQYNALARALCAANYEGMTVEKVGGREEQKRAFVNNNNNYQQWIDRAQVVLAELT